MLNDQSVLFVSYTSTLQVKYRKDKNVGDASVS